MFAEPDTEHRHHSFSCSKRLGHRFAWSPTGNGVRLSLQITKTNKHHFQLRNSNAQITSLFTGLKPTFVVFAIDGKCDVRFGIGRRLERDGVFTLQARRLVRAIRKHAIRFHVVPEQGKETVSMQLLNQKKLSILCKRRLV